MLGAGCRFRVPRTSLLNGRASESSSDTQRSDFCSNKTKRIQSTAYADEAYGKMWIGKKKTFHGYRLGNPTKRPPSRRKQRRIVAGVPIEWQEGRWEHRKEALRTTSASLGTSMRHFTSQTLFFLPASPDSAYSWSTSDQPDHVRPRLLGLGFSCKEGMNAIREKKHEVWMLSTTTVQGGKVLQSFHTARRANADERSVNQRYLDKDWEV